MKNALVLVPHPDDEIFCSAIIHNGDYRVTYLLFNDERHDEWEAAHPHENMEYTPIGLKDAAFYETKNAWKRSMEFADAAFKEKQPDLVLIPARSHDRDHCFVNEIGRCMTRENGNHSFGYEVLEYGYPPCMTQGWTPDIFIELPHYRYERKMEMWEKYRSQHKKNMKSWFTLHGLLTFDKGIGSMIGVTYAEPYKHVFSKVK